MRAGIPTRSDAGGAAERLDLETGVVRDGRQTGPPGAEAGLDPSVRLERLAGLIRVVGHAQVVERHELRPVQAQELTQLSQLVHRVRGDEQTTPTGHGARLPRSLATPALIGACPGWRANERSDPWT